MGFAQNALLRNDMAGKNSKIITNVIEGTLLLVALIIALIVRVTWIETAIIVSGSMRPTLQVNSRLLVDHRASLQGTWQRGDIVVFDNPPNWPPDTYVKRIIGVPGDTIQLINGQFFLNGKKLSESYVTQKPVRETYKPWRLSDGQYFVMGDNRNYSEDSRDHGPILNENIRGRVFYQIWPLSGFGKIPRIDDADNQDSITTKIQFQPH